MQIYLPLFLTFSPHFSGKIEVRNIRYLESNMVDIWKDNTNEIVKKFFKENIPSFSLIKDSLYGPYWNVEFVCNETKIKIGGDIGFSIEIFINETNYPLWQYDRSVNNKTNTSKDNILYQLNILKRFLG